MMNEVNERISETIEMLRTIRASIISDPAETPCRIEDVNAGQSRKTAKLIEWWWRYDQT